MSYGDNILKWMSDWADAFAQEWTDDQLRDFCGKTVEMGRPGNVEGQLEPKTFTFSVVGFSRDTLVDPDGESSGRTALLTDDGNQIFIYSGTTIEVVEPEVEKV